MSTKAINWVDRLAEKVSRAERAVLRHHANRANIYWASWAATEDVAKRTQYAPRTVENAERSLAAKGLMIPVPWVTNYGRETSSGFFLKGVFTEYGELPDIYTAFRDRIEFCNRKGEKVGGQPRGFVPPWWSGRGIVEGSQDRTPQEGLRGPKNNALRGPAHGTPITTSSNHQEKTVKDAAIAPSRVPDASASGVEVGQAPPPRFSDDADASSAAAEAAARRSDRLEAARNAKRTPRRQPLPDRLDEHLAELGPEAVDEILDDLETSRAGITYGWAAKTARDELGLDASDNPHDEPGGMLARKIVALAVMRLRKPDGGGLPDLAHAWLCDFDWPPDREAPERESTRKERPQLPRVKYYGSPNGDEKTHQVLYRQVNELSDDELAAKLDQLKQYRPKILRDSMAEAVEQLQGEGSELDQSSINSLTFKYAIRHYKGRWPMFVVPVEPKSDAA